MKNNKSNPIINFIAIIILFLILLITLDSKLDLFSKFKPSQVRTQQTENDQRSNTQAMNSTVCTNSSECIARFYSCDCQYHCYNKNSEFIDCPQECKMVIPPKPGCQCIADQCIEVVSTNSEEENIKIIKAQFDAYLYAEETCDIKLMNELITEASKKIVRLTCSNMANEMKCYIDRNFEVAVKDDQAVLYLLPFSQEIENPFFFTKENGIWKVDLDKMSMGLTMGGSTCDSGWEWRSSAIRDEFMSIMDSQNMDMKNENDVCGPKAMGEGYSPEFCDRTCQIDKDCKFSCGCGAINAFETCHSELIDYDCAYMPTKCESGSCVFVN